MAAYGPRTVAAILVAAGDGRRLGADVPKAFVQIADRTLLEHAVARFAEHPAVRDVIVAAPAALVDSAAALVPEAQVVAGGHTRQLSVAAALAALADDVDTVLVHDVARPFVPVEVISRVIDALAQSGLGGAIPILPVTDTIRRADPATGDLVETLDRSTLVAVQTPQGFPRAVLVEAHARARGVDAGDDAALVEAIGGRVAAVRGDEQSFKITHPWDLVLADAVAT
ncbi:MAG: 2-C-methyl-D-erythritol 4-phosphate cytidylyltransferase [Pseudonocardiales bacterium]|jgi:2-C-methyl-D-erythritol 4-phosphate cytidylyltransferase|nr:2-C-methyl-D-erythritol 4-phosphate cytidylyltransferase [Pseudonocardiales bacterium]